ncbi:MAG: Sua5/YciO/YrdC/YwlC family protein, partial [Planctomycetota bacterium]
VAVLAAGGIIALKGLGGFHLACDAANGAAVRRLRERKERPCKPFALMSRSLDNIACYAEVSESERALLESPARPIVLLRQRPQTVVAPEVAPGVPEFGVMLAYTPLHMLLFETGVRFAALVMTSGNRRDEPLARTNDEARERLAGIADGFLVHDRDIHNRADDSIVRVVGAQVPSPQWGEGGALAPGEGATPDLTHPLTPRSLRSRRPSPHRGEGIPPVQVIRRARGFVPEAIPIDVEQSVFAAGAELKSSFCLTSPGAAVLSPYLGDLDDERTLAFYTETLAKYERLLDVRPAVVACDLHPDYLSTRCAETYAHERGLPLVRVQHHEAHVASVLAERGWRGEQPVLGVAFDGTGLGTDGRAWGGEFFLCADSVAMQRVAHLEYFPLPGGDVAAREVWRAALALLWQSGNSLNTEDAEDRRGKTLNHRDTETQRRKIIGSCSSAFLCVLCVEKSRVEAALRLLAADANCPRTSSVGRLFDAASVLAGLGTSASYEAEAAMRLEAACGDEFLPYPCVLAEGPPARILLEPLVRALGADAGNPARLAARFHATVGEMILTVAERCRTAYGARTVALSGGVFQNRVLTRLASSRLAGRGFEVWLNHLVPPNDGGLALGQAWLASQAGKVR